MRATLVVIASVATMACTSPKPTRDDSLDLLARLERASSGERDRLVREAIAQRGTPLVEGDSALFFVEGRSGAPPRLLADFNGWGEPEERLAQAAMTPLEGTSWYYLKHALDSRARIEYAIARESTEDTALHLDPENPRTVEGFSRSYSELLMPDHPGAPELLEDPAVPRGRLMETEFESQIRGNRRKISIYLPAGYEESGDRRYPTAYFGDRTDYVSMVPVPRILDNTIARGTVRPLIAVFVEPAPRSEEYRMNEQYRRFFAEELVPWIDSRYRTIASAEARAVLGGSRGGLAAADIAYSHSDVFGACGAIAPAVSPTNLIELIAQGDVRPVRFFVLVGLYDLDWRPDGIALYEALRSRGYDAGFLEIPEGHSWSAWKSHIDDALLYLFPAEIRTS
jgi:enterochelin esterase family protein